MEEVKIRTSPERLKTLVVGSKVFRSSNDCELSPEDLEKARLELGETEEVRENSLRTLREMLSRDATRYRTDDAYLLRFLRYKKFKCDEAHKMVSYFYSVRTDHPDVFYTIPEDLEDLLNTNLFAYLPYRDEDGSIIFLNRLGRWNAQQHSLYNLVQFGQIIADVISLNPACQINKVVGIYDFEGTSIRHFTAAINPIAMVFMVKMLQIIVLGSDMSELHKYVSPAILPKDCGGTLEEDECGITQHVMDNLPYLRYERSFCNERKL